MSKYDANWEERLSERPVTHAGFSDVLIRRIQKRARHVRHQRPKIKWASFGAALLMILMFGFTMRLATQSFRGTSGSAAISHWTMQRLDMLNDTDGWAILNQGAQVVRTTDGGTSWKDVSPVRTSSINTLSMAQFVDKDTAWVALSNSLTREDVNVPLKVFFTSDGGAHWRSSTLPMDGLEHPYPIGIDFLDRNQGWLLVSHTTGVPLHEQTALFQTTDGGDHWTHISETTRRDEQHQVYDNGLFVTANPTGLVFQTRDKGWMTLGGPVGANSPVYQTKDGGRTWFPAGIPAGISLEANGMVQPGHEYAYNGEFPLHFYSANDGVIGINYYSPASGYVNVLYSTHDGGLHWTPSRGKSFSFSQRSIATSVGWFDILSPSQNWLLSGYSLYHATDGQTWTSIPLRQALVVVDFVNSNRGWALSSAGQLLKTTDGGLHWQDVHALMMGGD